MDPHVQYAQKSVHCVLFIELFCPLLDEKKEKNCHRRRKVFLL